MAKREAVKAGEESAFFEQGRDWEADRQSRYERSERRAWFAFGAMGIIAVAAVIGMASMAPFKRVVPYVFTVDRATGNVEAVSASDDRTIKSLGYQELTDKNLAKRYVIARESYYWPLLQYDYNQVLAWSSDPVGRDFARLYEGSTARDKKYGASLDMRVKVLSVTLAQDEVGTKAVVRFEKTTKRTEATEADPPVTFVATLAFEYKPSMFGKEADLIDNPLGYRVVTYRVDSEVATATPAAGTVAAAVVQ
jgi:type IV secretion system protein VirB8